MELSGLREVKETSFEIVKDDWNVYHLKIAYC